MRMEHTYRAIRMKPADQVAVALTPIPKGAAVKVTTSGSASLVEVMDEIEFGHKFAVVPIRKGDNVLKYGEVIGIAVRDISAGEHVHIHNLEGKRGRGDKIAAQ